MWEESFYSDIRQSFINYQHKLSTIQTCFSPYQHTVKHFSTMQKFLFKSLTPRPTDQHSLCPGRMQRSFSSPLCALHCWLRNSISHFTTVTSLFRCVASVTSKKTHTKKVSIQQTLFTPTHLTPHPP